MNRKLKKAVIREEFVVLTGDYIKAIILNQFLYWTDRINDIDNFITEERKRLEQEGLSVNIDLQKGWIYKTAEELLDEIMLGMAQTTIRVHVKKLLEAGYLLERNNPKFKWDKTKQYRVDLLKIQTDLFKLGYTLQGYKLPLIVAPISETKLPSSESELREYENRGAIPDITLNIKNNIYIPYKEIIEYLNLKAGTSYKHSSKSTQKHIHARWEEGHRLEDFITVIDNKVTDWLDDVKYSKYLRPETLFGTKFESYLNKPKATQSTNTQQPNRSDLKQLASNDDPEYLEFLRIEREKEAQRKLGVTGY